MSSNCAKLPNQQPKEIHFMMIQNRSKQQIPTLEKQVPVNVWQFILINYLKSESHVKDFLLFANICITDLPVKYFITIKGWKKRQKQGEECLLLFTTHFVT